MIVCIAEKPSVALEIAKILGASQRKDGYFEGNGYQVTWTFGHLCMLKSPEDYKDIWKKWQLSSLPMIPDEFEVKLIDTPVYKKQFKIIKELFLNYLLKVIIIQLLTNLNLIKKKLYQELINYQLLMIL